MSTVQELQVKNSQSRMMTYVEYFITHVYSQRVKI